MNNIFTFLLGFTLLFTSISCNKNPVSPTLSGDRIAYTDGTNIFIRRMDDSNEQQIKIKQITNNLDPVLQIESLNVDHFSNFSDLKWSPDGKKIAFVASRGPDQSQLLVLDVASGIARTASYDLQMVSNPDWSPDGKKVVYSMATGLWGSLAELFETDLENNTWRQLTEIISRETLYYGSTGSPRWSKDGNSIYFLAYREYHMSDVMRYDFSTAQIDTLDSLYAGKCVASDGSFAIADNEKDTNNARIIHYNLLHKINEILTNDSHFNSPRLINNDSGLLLSKDIHLGNGEWDSSLWVLTIEDHKLQHFENGKGINGTNALDLFYTK